MHAFPLRFDAELRGYRAITRIRSALKRHLEIDCGGPSERRFAILWRTFGSRSCRWLTVGTGAAKQSFTEMRLLPDGGFRQTFGNEALGQERRSQECATAQLSAIEAGQHRWCRFTCELVFLDIFGIFEIPILKRLLGHLGEQTGAGPLYQS
jgi:hypothetical protein